MSFSNKKAITIDHTKVIGSDQSSFPFPIVRTSDNDLRTIANGGHVTSASGFDIIFKDSTESVTLSHEIKRYVASTGEIIMWVKAPTLSHTSDSVIYMYYGDASITTSQENATDVWSNGYLAVWHLEENTGTSNSIKDSTANANHATPYSSYSGTTGDISTTGKIGTGQHGDGNDNAIAGPNSSSLNVGGSGIKTLGISVSYKRGAVNATGTFLSKGTPGQGGYLLALGTGFSPNADTFKATKYGVADIFPSGTAPQDTNWHRTFCRWNATNTKIFLDGSSNGTDSNTQDFKTDNAGFFLLYGDGGWGGDLDEVFVHSADRSDDWIATEANAIGSPSTFYSVGSEQSTGGTATKSLPVRTVVATRVTKSLPVRVLVRTQQTKSLPVRSVIRTLKTISLPVRLVAGTRVTKSLPIRALIRTLKTVSLPIRTVVRGANTLSLPVRSVVATRATKSMPVRTLTRTLRTLSAPLRTTVRTMATKSLAIRTKAVTPATKSLPVRCVVRGRTWSLQIRTVVASQPPVTIYVVATGRDGIVTARGH